MTAIGAVLRKARQNAQWDVAFLRSAPLPRGERVEFVVAKYRAIVANARQVTYLGARLEYDNRLTPALLERYPLDVARLDSLVELRSATTVLDVGANVGQFAATAIGLFPGLRVWSLEPNPASFALLERNASRHPHWHALAFGVADSDQHRRLWFVADKSAQASVHRENARLGLVGGKPRSVDVDLRRLTRALCAEHGMPGTFDVVKVDVEGFEREALTGLRDVSWRHLTVETSVGRSGGLDVDAAEVLVRELWGQGCHLVDASPVEGGVRETVFRGPMFG